MPTQPASRQPAAVQPALPKKRPVPTTPQRAEPEVKPGDLVCTNCGTGNDPVRRFCRRCGQSLMTAVVARRPPWYRRLFRRERALAAGARPDAMGRRGRPKRSIVKTLFVLLLLAALIAPIAGYFALPDFRDKVNATVADLRLTFLPKLEDVHPTAVGKGAAGHDGKLAVDGNINTFWQSDQADDPMVLSVQFAEPTDLGGLVFHLGSATDAQFLFFRRPRNVRLTFHGSTTAPIEVELTDDSAPQTKTIDVRKVTSLELQVLTFYEHAQGGQDAIALREVEFKARH